jgi:hypothetical protein
MGRQSLHNNNQEVTVNGPDGKGEVLKKIILINEQNFLFYTPKGKSMYMCLGAHACVHMPVSNNKIPCQGPIIFP